MNNDRLSNNTDELDEIAKSVEKLIDEETSVAKAFVDRDIKSQVQDDILGRTQALPNIGEAARTRNTADRNASQTRNASQVKNSSQLSQSRSSAQGRTSGAHPASNNAQRQQDRNSGKSNAKNSSKNNSSRNSSSRSNGRKGNASNNNKAMLMLIAGVLALAVVMLIIVSVILNNSKKNSYDYNYSTGLQLYNSGSYSEALTYWEKASADSAGRKNVELKIKMHECYVALGNKDKAAEVLKDALSYDKYNQKALTMLAQYYVNQKDGTGLSELLRKYKGTDGEKYLKDFEVAMPSASEASGKFDKVVELELKSVNSYKIYYTVDGSTVTTKSKEYNGPIRIEKGKTTLKAVTVDAIGTMSHELELVFEVDYKNPDAPVVTPLTGTYSAGTKIEITNIPEGGKAYYTLDGKAPTKESTEYTEPIAMPEGNTVFSAIIIDSSDLESAVTKRNYNVGVTTKYTFDEAVDRLKVAMILKDDLNKDGTSADGGQAKFTYYKKTSIANVEMYITFYDIIKNGVTTRQPYYFGIDTSTGKCYKVYDQNGSLIATEY